MDTRQPSLIYTSCTKWSEPACAGGLVIALIRHHPQTFAYLRGKFPNHARFHVALSFPQREVVFLVPGGTLDCMNGGTGIAVRPLAEKDDCQRTGEESSPKTRRGWRPSLSSFCAYIIHYFFRLVKYFAKKFLKKLYIKCA